MTKKAPVMLEITGAKLSASHPRESNGIVIYNIIPTLSRTLI